MGVPSFFKWLCKRYPKSVTDAQEAKDASGQTILTSSTTTPENTTSSSTTVVDDGTIRPLLGPIGSNPLIDNLYLDMNGIIHPCCHPEEGGSYTEEEMIQRCWEYVQRIVGLVRPQRVLYMAIDGVGPRAKLNQQRSRRFRSAREAKEKKEVKTKLAAEWLERGLTLPKGYQQLGKAEEWDVNVITPGTQFMAKVAQALHYHIEYALQFDPTWRHLTVLFSDATVPGEGEHKIINWIRAQRSEVGYDPNTRHCLCGQDADLIMLGLATHERYFYIIRENLGDQGAANIRCTICGDMGHYNDQCTGEKWKKKVVLNDNPSNSPVSPPSSPDPDAVDPLLIPQTMAASTAYQFVHLPIFREYLTRELSLPPAVTAVLQFPYNFENMLDDFVLLCMFVGNDFLPHLPSLEIKEGAIEMLLKIYKELLPKLDGYLSSAGIVQLPRLGLLLEQLGLKENEIFNRRRSKEENHKRKDKEHKERVLRIRRENAKKERELNKTGTFFYEDPDAMEMTEEKKSSVIAPETISMQLSTPTSTPVVSLPLPPLPPTTSGYIHPSRQQSDPTSSAPPVAAVSSSSGFQRNSGEVAPPPTPITPTNGATVVANSAPPSTTTTPSPSIPIPAPKANLSAAALLRQKLKGGKVAAATSNPALAEPVLPSVVTPTDSNVGSGSMDLSSLPSSDPQFLRVVSDPIPGATAAMSSLTTNHTDPDDTPAKANARAAQLLKQTMLGKRKEPMAKTTPTAPTPPIKQHNDMEDALSPNAMTDTTDSSALPTVSLSTSPSLEIPLKKSKQEAGETTTSDPSDERKEPSVEPTLDDIEHLLQRKRQELEATSSSASVTSPTKSSFNPNETDQFGNLVREQNFETYFSAKWEQMNQPEVEDKVRFGQEGWKERYYQEKLHFNFTTARADPISSDARVAFNLYKTYLEGLCWVMSYYYHGPSSWSWFYPFHYAPMAEDLAVFLKEGNLKQVEFTLGEPFEPIAQLMAVLPARSSHCVPKAARKLMTSNPSSPLAAFYPDEFELDLNGKKFMWQAVALLPFIDGHLLLSELNKLRQTFTQEEIDRNTRGFEYVFANAHTAVGQFILKHLYQAQFSSTGFQTVRSLTRAQTNSATSVSLDPTQTHGFSGQLKPYSGASLPSLPSVHFAPKQPQPTQHVEVASSVYQLPPYHRHSCELLPGIDPFQPQLQESDYLTMRERREFVPRNNRENGGQRGPFQIRGFNGANVNPTAGGAFPQPPVIPQPGAPQQLGYYYNPNAPPHLAGHALNPNFYPPPPTQQMLFPVGFVPPPSGSYYPPPPPPPQPQYGYPPMMMQPPPMGFYPPPMMGYPPQLHGALPTPPYPHGPPPPPHLQAFLAAPPPPGKPPGWIPPPMQQMIPGFNAPPPPPTQ